MARAAPPTGRTGRRPGSPDTRAAILGAARTSFAQDGFDKSSMRAIARRAGVDPALIHHYFESKDDLMLAALDIGVDPRPVVAELAHDGVDGLGDRLIHRFLAVWDDEALRSPLVALVKAATTSDAAAELLRQGFIRMLVESIADVIEADDAVLRAQAVASQLLGIIMARYVVRLEPLASTAARELELRYGPTLQHYLDGPA